MRNSIPPDYQTAVTDVNALKTGFGLFELSVGTQLRAHDTRLAALETLTAAHTRQIAEIQNLTTSITASPITALDGESLYTLSGNTIDAKARTAKAA